MTEFPYVIDTGLQWPTPLVKRRITDHIQLHHTVGKYGTVQRWADLHQDRIADGQRGVPYSYLVLQDGSIFKGRGHEYGHGGVKDNITNNANQRSAAVALDGDMRGDGLPTEKQLAAALRLVKDLMALYKLPASAVLGHNEIPTYENGKPTGKTYATLCPCVDMKAFRAALVAAPVPEPTPEPKPEPKPEPEQPTVLTFPALYAYDGDSGVNVRGGPGASFGAIGKYPLDKQHMDEECIVLAVKDGWAEVILHQRDTMLRGWCVDTYMRRV